MKISKRTKGNLLLLLAAFIWGTAFVAQKSGVEEVDPITFNGIRALLGFMVLLPVVIVGDMNLKKQNKLQNINIKTTVTGGIVCGIVFLFATVCQTAAMVGADAGKGGFLTSLYIIMVPISGIFIGKKTRPLVWICAVAATLGLYLICMKGSGFSFDRYEILLLIGAVFFTLQLFAVDYYAPKVNPVKLAALQFLTVGILSLVYTIFIDKPSLSTLLNAAFPLIYAGAISLGIGNTLQVIGQKYTEPSVASVIMSMEALFALLAGIALSGDRPDLKELIGCALMMASILLVQLPESKKEVQ